MVEDLYIDKGDQRKWKYGSPVRKYENDLINRDSIKFYIDNCFSPK